MNVDGKRLMILPGLIVAILLIVAFSTFAADNEGFIYGKVTTINKNEYRGLIRWGDEEAFWDDLFNSAKVDFGDSDHWDDYEEALKEYQEEALEEAQEALEESLDEMSEEADEMDEEADEMEEEAEDMEEELDDLREDLDNLRLREREIREVRRQAEHIRKQADRMRKEIERKRERGVQSVEHSVVSTRGTHTTYLRVNRDDFSIPVLPHVVFDQDFNLSINTWGGTRQFMVRFGDIKKIDVTGEEDAYVTMRNGESFEVSGYANDVGGKLLINDPAFGEITVPWDNIKTIEFMDTPSSAKTTATRIHGVMQTEAGEFRGYIQWDSQECLTTDELDGESEDGDLSIKFGAIKSISRRNRRGAEVELKDGRSIVLEGTNDVNESNRGIYVEDERYGRVRVPWDIFDTVVFDDKGSSGRSYKWYDKQKSINGKVKTTDGLEFEGRIIYDMDESGSFEILNGKRFDVEYFIPFDLIQTITPRSRNSSEVVLANGDKLRLYDQQDVGDSNDGILIYPKGSTDDKDAHFVPWGSIEVIELTW